MCVRSPVLPGDLTRGGRAQGQSSRGTGGGARPRLLPWTQATPPTSNTWAGDKQIKGSLSPEPKWTSQQGGGSLIITLDPFLPTNPTSSSKSQSPHHTFQAGTCVVHPPDPPPLSPWLMWLQPHRPACSSPNPPGTVLPQGLCSSSCLDHSCPRIHRLEPSPPSCLYSGVTSRDFPGGAVVTYLPANAGDAGSIPCPGRSHIPQSS